MSADLEKRRFGGPDPVRRPDRITRDVGLIALLFAALWMFLQLAMAVRL
jgi:hypothetical protein